MEYSWRLPNGNGKTGSAKRKLYLKFEDAKLYWMTEVERKPFFKNGREKQKIFVWKHLESNVLVNLAMSKIVLLHEEGQG